MNGAVSNSTPLIYLAKAGRIDLLKKVFKTVYIPQEVKNEVVDKGKLLGEQDAYIVEKAINEGWLQVVATKKIEVPIKLHEGEIAALSLAKQLNLTTILLDEISARSAAIMLNLTPRGTIFVLLKAQQKKEIDLDECIEILNLLINKGLRLKEEVYIETIKQKRKIAAQT